MTEPILVQGKKRGAERCYGIVTDERRGPDPKSARRKAVALSRLPAASRAMQVAPLPAATRSLPNDYDGAITAVVLTEFEPKVAFARATRLR